MTRIEKQSLEKGKLPVEASVDRSDHPTREQFIKGQEQAVMDYKRWIARDEAGAANTDALIAELTVQEPLKKQLGWPSNEQLISLHENKASLTRQLIEREQQQLEIHRDTLLALLHPDKQAISIDQVLAESLSEPLDRLRELHPTRAEIYEDLRLSDGAIIRTLREETKFYEESLKAQTPEV